MLATRFNLIYKGEIYEGYALENVKKSISELFELDDAGVDEFFSGRPVALTKNVDAVTGETYQKALACVGALTHLEPVQTGRTHHPERTERRRRERRLCADRRASYRGSSIQPDRRTKERRSP